MRGEQSLVGHSASVARCAQLLLDERASASVAAAGLRDGARGRLELIVQVGAWLHDLGKCSRPFQEMLRGSREMQPVRHEAISLWLVWPGQPLAEWLHQRFSANDLRLAAVVAAGHHRKFHAHAMAPADAGAGSLCEALTGHPDFAELLNLIARELELKPPPRMPNIDIPLVGSGALRGLLGRWQVEFEAALDEDDEARRLLPLAKALVLAADVAGSALPRDHDRPDWIVTELRRRASRERLRSVVDDRLRGASPRPFQRAVGESTASVTLVRAGCGSGKTAAAYLWAAEQHAGRQLWVTYPTTGTATEGFRDYVLDADVAARLEHGRANVDMAMLLGDDAGPLRELDRLDALRNWGSEVVTCTSDTVLGLVQNQRKGLYAWPGLAESAIVFDEIHAYDELMFGTLLRLLESLPGLPVLLMTASLPSSRLERLGEVCRIHRHAELQIVDGPEELECLPRYRRRDVDRDAVWSAVAGELEAGGKVLWVSNTVARATAAFDQARERGFSEVASLYHSRYRYVDRVARHAEVIRRFREPGAAIALTTQVAEMSLDLSATLLVTDLAPIPALIQRLGRLNRRATPEVPGSPRDFIVLPFNGLPYSAQELRVAIDWLTALGNEALSQRALVSAWKQDRPEEQRREPAGWLDGDFSTEPSAVREASPGLTVMREADQVAAARAPSRMAELLIPMGPLPGDSWRGWKRFGGAALIAPDSALQYDELRGGQWRK